MTMTAPEHVHLWQRPLPTDRCDVIPGHLRCDCGVSWEEWLREAYG